jgi:Translation initiation factor IF-2, N-terminal region
MSKVRIYDLAKELRLESRKVLEDVRRFGAKVSAPSSSVDAAIAEKICELYYPKKQSAQRAPRLVKAHKTAPADERHPEAGSAVVSSSEEAARETEANTESQTSKIEAAAKSRAIKIAPAARRRACRGGVGARRGGRIADGYSGAETRYADDQDHPSADTAAAPRGENC